MLDLKVIPSKPLTKELYMALAEKAWDVSHDSAADVFIRYYPHTCTVEYDYYASGWVPKTDPDWHFSSNEEHNCLFTTLENVGDVLGIFTEGGSDEADNS